MGWMIGIDKPFSARRIEPRRWRRLVQPFLSKSSQGHRQGVPEDRVRAVCGMGQDTVAGQRQHAPRLKSASCLPERCAGVRLRCPVELNLCALGLAVLLVRTLSAETAPAGRFESLGIPVRVGGLMGCVVGPNGRGGEALYFNFNQISGKLFLVQVNPDTAEARQFNAPQGPGAWALIAGPDEKIYLGTWDGGLILRFDPKQPGKGIEVVGKPSPTEEYLWQYDLGKDGKLYGCTYPQAKLVRFDPKTGAMEDLGRMHPTEMYARSVAVGPNGKVYVGIGTEKGDLVVFDPATKEPCLSGCHT
jgi:hypothetical protein